MALPSLTPGDQRDWFLPRFWPQSSTYSRSTPAPAAPMPMPITAAVTTMSAAGALPAMSAPPGHRLYRADRRRTIPTMARALHRPLSGAFVALALLASAIGAQPADVPAVAEKLLQGFAATHCRHRWQTIEEYIDRVIGRVLNYTEPAAEITDSLRELAAAKGPAGEQEGQRVTGYTDEASQAFARLAKVSQSVDRTGSPPDVWRKGLPPLTRVLEDPGEGFMTRWLAAAVIAESS